jgi:hypothetical protein
LGLPIVGAYDRARLCARRETYKRERRNPTGANIHRYNPCHSPLTAASATGGIAKPAAGVVWASRGHTR